MGRRCIVRYAGLYTRENVGMSSVRQVRILSAENLRFPEEGSSTQEIGRSTRLNSSH